MNEIRDRVRARHPQGEVRGLNTSLPNLLPILHARDRIESKVAAIGSVNPRPPGLLNNLIQFVKRSIARSLGWFVRDQVDFNRAVLSAIEATLESLNEVNRTFSAAGARLEQADERASRLQEEASALQDVRAHWTVWREEWQQKLFQNEIHYLRGLADLQGSLDVRMARVDENYRNSLQLQHSEYEEALRTSIGELQRKFWEDLDKIRMEYEALIHSELRVLRQRMVASPVAGPVQNAPSASTGTSSAAAPPELDYGRFASRFRGSEEYVKEQQRFYLSWFRGCRNVLDIGCGRGEFLGLMQEAGVAATGLDLDEESVRLCRQKGYRAETGDVFDWLANEPDGAFDGIFAAQVIEHLTPAQVPRLVRLCAAKLARGGLLALETPNPECLAIFATHFYLDPTHQRPVPPNLLVFYFEEAGLGGIEVHRLAPAAESLPSIQDLPPRFAEAFFGGLDYCAIGRKL